MPSGRLRIIVLAGQRPGQVDPLAVRFGVSHKCLVPLNGRALIAYVVETAARHPAVESVVISVELDAVELVERSLPAPGQAGATIGFAAAADNLADSVREAATGHDGTILITTADNPLLSAASIDAMAKALSNSDVALAMAPREAVLATHLDGQRRFYRFRDGEYSNCNLYGIADKRALAAAEIFRSGGQFAKKASRIIAAFGLFNLLLLRFRLISLSTGLGRISRRLGLSIAPVILNEGSQAIDVDNDRTYGIVAELLERRRAA